MLDEKASTKEIPTNFLIELREGFERSVQASTVHYDNKMLTDALEFATNSHENQFRKSGVPYVVHPVEVGKILIDLRMDNETVASGLLHDVVEDCEVPLEEVKTRFGAKVAFLVDAVTKISVIQDKSIHERQAGTYRKMMISIAKDFRVVMIKFADRLHNMRTLNFLSEEKREKISKETLNFYAPLANRFGLYQIRRELEDLSFKNLYTHEYKRISNEIQISEADRQQCIADTVQKIENIFKKKSFFIKVFGRTKNLYGIYRKMQIKECDFKSLYDVFALRVIVKKDQDCYRALGLIHQVFVPLMTRFKDYISLPKANMYQSLHTVVIGFKGLPVEFQIRTEQMDDIAEKGIAAHWFYKEKHFEVSKNQIGKVEGKVDINTVETKWLEDFMQWQENLNDSVEFVDFLHLDVKKEQEIFVFTPKGDLFRLYNGSTVLDFAFAVHTEVGKNCIGAKIDGGMVAFSKVLKTGDTVEILTSKEQKPLYSWLRLTSTSKARIAIRKHLKDEGMKKHSRIGKKLLEKEFTIYQLNKDEILPFFKQQFSISNWNELYSKVAQGKISFKQVVQFIRNLHKKESMSPILSWFKRWIKSNSNFSIRISGQEDDWFKTAPCCMPVHGDKIVGYILKNKEGVIHRINCEEVVNLKKLSEARKISVRWEKSNKNKYFQASIEVLATDRQGLLEDMTSIFSHYQVNIDRAVILTHQNQIRDRFRVSVSSLNNLEESLTKIRAMKGVQSVVRLHGKKIV